MKNAAFGAQPWLSREQRVSQSHLLPGVECLYNRPLKNMGLNYMGLLTCGFLKINTIRLFSPSMVFLIRVPSL